jgi:hypothetical protein
VLFEATFVAVADDATPILFIANSADALLVWVAVAFAPIGELANVVFAAFAVTGAL